MIARYKKPVARLDTYESENLIKEKLRSEEDKTSRELVMTKIKKLDIQWIAGKNSNQ